MKRILGLAAALGIMMGGFALAQSRPDHSAHAAYCDAAVPLGAISPAIPEWCKLPLATGIDTHVEGANSWVDNFDHGQTHATLNSSYRTYTIGDGGDTLHFQHNNHWMVDIQTDADNQYPTLLAAATRPNRSFKSENGLVVVEFEVAVPIAGTRDATQISDSWPEFVVTLVPDYVKPYQYSWLRPNGTYVYEGFPQDWTFGCRIQQSRHPICALYKPDNDGVDNYAGGPDRLWEINQNGGDVTDEFGGDPSSVPNPNVWKTCSSVDDPDTVCRNQFRVELTSNRIKIFVNGVRWYEAGLIDNNLGNIINNSSGFYYYLGDFAYRIEGNTTLRFHWDHLAVNPESGGGSPPPTPTPTSALPTNTPTATPTVAPATPTPTATPALCGVYRDGSASSGFQRGSLLYVGTLINGECRR